MNIYVYTNAFAVWPDEVTEAKELVNSICLAAETVGRHGIGPPPSVKLAIERLAVGSFEL